MTIDLSGLDKIRRDAQITRDSLLTEEDLKEDEPGLSVQTPHEPVSDSEKSVPEPQTEAAIQPFVENVKTPVHEAEGPATIEIPSLDEVHTQILLTVMRGESAAELIRQRFLMPSVVTDTINEALFDEIGDNVLECDGEEITFVEDYREELNLIIGGEG